jgi:hypothetical protein
VVDIADIEVAMTLDDPMGPPPAQLVSHDPRPFGIS